MASFLMIPRSNGKSMNPTKFLILMFVLCGNHLIAQRESMEITDLRKNSIYLEFGDVIVSPSYSINYDRTFALGDRQIHSLGLRTGIMVTRCYINHNTFSIPIEAYYLLGKRICFETGFSYAHCFDKPDFHAIGVRAGMRWRSKEGILVRVAATPTIANDGIETFFFRTYGISMGYSF
jgi:hypothetical protein